MPGRKGRKRRLRDRDRRRDLPPALPGEGKGHDSADAPRTSPTPSRRRAAAQSDAQQRLPSTGARLSGAMLAVLTAALSFLLIYNALLSATGIDAIVRIAGGLAMLLLAIVVGLLSLAPQVVQSWVSRRR